jgi:hypothetical protein
MDAVVVGVPFSVLWKHGLSLLEPECRWIMRLVCKSWRASIKENFRFPVDDVVNYAAFNGYLALCELAFAKWGATDRDGMLVSGARGGHTDVCFEARKGGATKLHPMVEAAARAGHKGPCVQALEWMTGGPRTESDPDTIKIALISMLKLGATGGHMNICVCAKEEMDTRSGLRLDKVMCKDMVYSAARNGHLIVLKNGLMWMTEALSDPDLNFLQNRLSRKTRFAVDRKVDERKCARVAAKIAHDNNHDECARFCSRFSITGDQDMLFEQT